MVISFFCSRSRPLTSSSTSSSRAPPLITASAPEPKLSELAEGPDSWSTEDPNFLRSRNKRRLLAFLLFVEGVFFLASVGVRAGAAVTVPLLSKEQEKRPLVRWNLKLIF